MFQHLPIWLVLVLIVIGIVARLPKWGLSMLELLRARDAYLEERRERRYPPLADQPPS